MSTIKPEMCDSQETSHLVVSLYQLLDAIASKIELPDNLEREIRQRCLANRPHCGFYPEENHLHAMKAEFLVGLLRSISQSFRAAAIFDFHLRESASGRPAWRNWLLTGQAACLESDEQARAMSALSRILQGDEQYVLAYLDETFPVSLHKGFEEFEEIRSSLVYGQLIAGDVKRRVSADPVDRLAPARRPGRQ
ncbi:hypothetical protein, partial [Paraburkholderia phenoliruptrix]